MVDRDHFSYPLNKVKIPLYLNSANRIGNTLCRDAIWDRDRCTWLGWEREMHGSRLTPVYRAFGADLYSGSSGIALFLAELYVFSHDKQQLRTIEGAVNQVLSVYSKLPISIRHGFYCGHNGIAFALIRIGEILQRPVLIAHGLSMMQTLLDVPFDEKKIDVISGSAGAIPALLSIAKKYQRDDLFDLAIRHGRHLVTLAKYNEMGCSWATIDSVTKANLTGYSHGTAGIVTALLELYAVTSENELLNVANAALKYENNWFQQEESNWADLRLLDDTGDAVKCSMAWCHGAPGIGLARLRNKQLVSDKHLIQNDIEAALKSSTSALMQPWVPGKLNYSLCHGAAGNAEFMLQAFEDLKRPELMAIAEKVGQDGHLFYGKQGLPWPCGNAGIGELPGLMLGTAGIGYFYLRLYDTENVPSILLITPDL